MLQVYGCFAHQHDFGLLLVAVVLCALASMTAINLAHHAIQAGGRIGTAWLTIAAVASGSGIWATHFVAMLAYHSGLPVGYDPILTIASLASAIAVTASGLILGVQGQKPFAPWIGGAIVGGGIAVMHYTGMAAFDIPGYIVWNPGLVTASVLFGLVLGSLALRIGIGSEDWSAKIVGSLLLTAAICSHHFIAMGAVTIVPDPRQAAMPVVLPANAVAVAVALAGFTITLLACAAVALDVRDRRRSDLEQDRMRGLADAAVEGLLVCDKGTIVTANQSFAKLTGFDVSALPGLKLERFVPSEVVRSKLAAGSDQPIETVVRQADGAGVSVELIAHTIDYMGSAHQAIAVRDLRDRKQAERHIEFLAHHDVLTTLPNRAAFNTRLDQELATARVMGWRVAVLCLDLDRFKEVNDLFGHATGDELLRTVARCVTARLRNDQMMARLGGDEFAIIVPSAEKDLARLGELAESVLHALRRESENVPSNLTIGTSIGIAVFPNDAEDRETLLSHADTALYRAKSEGRGTYRFFEARMGAQVRDRRLLEHDLRQAIVRSEFHLVYQPQTAVDTGLMLGFEALLRWRHPERGEVSPGIFVPIAEESGAILQIGEWVLRTACAEAVRWEKPLRIAVNVSAVQMHNADFSSLVQDVLQQTGLAAGRLELEITETALIRDFDRALTTLRKLKALGVRIAMDDFGTGYSSLSNLRAFPFDKIKIDGSFIRSVNSNEQAATIVRAVLGLGRGLGLPVLAEGVETSAELAFLEDVHCDEAQGYLLGRPADIEVFAKETGSDPKTGSADAAASSTTIAA